MVSQPNQLLTDQDRQCLAILLQCFYAECVPQSAMARFQPTEMRGSNEIFKIAVNMMLFHWALKNKTDDCGIRPFKP